MAEEKEEIYIVLKDSKIFGLYDVEKWEEFNGHYKEKQVINRFTVYKGKINGKCMKIYWNRYDDIWLEDK